MKKLLLLIVTVLLIFSACKTKEERAKRLLDRANKLYPITQMKDTILKIDTIIVIDTVIVIEKDTVEIEVKIEKDDKGNFKTFKDKVLLDNEKAKILGTLDSNGNLKVSVEIKEKKIPLSLKIPFKHSYTTTRITYKYPPEIVKVKGFFWWTGLITFIGGIIFLGIKLFSRYGTGIIKR